MSAPSVHSALSHFDWVSELLFMGLLWVMITHLREFTLEATLHHDNHQNGILYQLLVTGCTWMTLLAEWIVLGLTMLTLYVQYDDQLTTHKDHHTTTTKPTESRAHQLVHNIFFGSSGRWILNGLMLFVYLLCTLHSVQYVFRVNEQHPTMSDGLVVMMWGTSVLFGATAFVFVVMLVCYGSGNITMKTDTDVLSGESRWVEDGSVV